MTNSATRMVDLGGRTVAVALAGLGTPAVVFESGYGFDMRLWRDVLPAVAASTQVVAYDRPGVGQSDPPPTPRESLQPVVDDLHAVLHAAHVTPPYMLVGHSFGGFVVRLYASQHPESVAGLVLIDAQVEMLLARQVAGLSPEQLQDRAERLLAPPVNPERHNVPPEQFVAPLWTMAPLPSIPVVVLTRGRTASGDPLPEELPEDHPEAWWQSAQRELVQAMPGSVHRLVPGSGHVIPRQGAEAVIAAIQEVLSQARDGR